MQIGNVYTLSKERLIRLEIQCHDIVIHLVSLTNIEISLGCLVHTHVEVEVDGFRISAVDIQADLARGGMKFLDGLDGLKEKLLAQFLSLEGGEYVYLL